MVASENMYCKMEMFTIFFMKDNKYYYLLSMSLFQTSWILVFITGLSASSWRPSKELTFQILSSSQVGIIISREQNKILSFNSSKLNIRHFSKIKNSIPYSTKLDKGQHKVGTISIGPTYQEPINYNDQTCRKKVSFRYYVPKLNPI